MKKWVGKIVVICFVLFNVSCQKDVYQTIDYETDVLVEYSDEIKMLFGDVKILSKETFTETYRSYSKIMTINYDVWQIEYINWNQEVKQTTFYNRANFIDLLSGLILEKISEELIRIIDLNLLLFIDYENTINNINKVEDIDPLYYPINLRLDDLPDNLLIVITPQENQLKEFNELKEQVIENVKLANIKNVLLLEGDDAYEMDHGVLLHMGVVIQEKISVKDAVEWIESNN